jgi:hypothetical protein
MALVLAKESPISDEFTIDYWKVGKTIIDWHNEKVIVELWGWVNKDDRVANRNIAFKHTYDSRGENFPIDNKSKDNVQTQIYDWIKAKTDWSGALDDLE